MEDLVKVIDGAVFTNSKAIADTFKKTHRNVLVDIRRLISNDNKFGGHNFLLSSYTSLQNKVLPCYDITRDGFSILAMGFTGREALEWKIKYIQAFNAMEEALLNPKKNESVQDALLEALHYMEKDKNFASTCGRGLSQWKQVRKDHMEKVNKLRDDVQLLLNIFDN